MGKVIGFCNQKGGTAKTTSVVNFASYLALAGKRVLLIDGDPQGNASSGLGIDSDNIEAGLYDVLIGRLSANECILDTCVGGLFVLPSNTTLAAAEIELVTEKDREYFLKDIIDDIKNQFDYVVIDSPPSLGILTLNILVASDSVIVPIQCEYYALEGVSRLVHTLDMVRERLNSKLEIEGILMTMADFRTRLTIQVIEEVRMFFKEKVYDTVIPRNVTLSEAPSFGKPAYLYNKHCTGAKAYFKHACEFLKEDIKGVYDGEESARSRSGYADTPKEYTTGQKDTAGAADTRIYVH